MSNIFLCCLRKCFISFQLFFHITTSTTTAVYWECPAWFNKSTIDLCVCLPPFHSLTFWTFLYFFPLVLPFVRSLSSPKPHLIQFTLALSLSLTVNPLHKQASAKSHFCSSQSPPSSTSLLVKEVRSSCQLSKMSENSLKTGPTLPHKDCSETRTHAQTSWVITIKAKIKSTASTTTKPGCCVLSDWVKVTVSPIALTLHRVVTHWK